MEQSNAVYVITCRMEPESLDWKLLRCTDIFVNKLFFEILVLL